MRKINKCHDCRSKRSSSLKQRWTLLLVSLCSLILIFVLTACQDNSVFPSVTASSTGEVIKIEISVTPAVPTTEPVSTAETFSATELAIAADPKFAEILNELAVLYNQFEPRVNLVFNFAAPDILLQQIEGGAPVDILLAGSEQLMSELTKSGHFESASVTNLLGDQIVLVVPGENSGGITGFSDFGTDKILSLGLVNPQRGLSGVAAEQVLQGLKLQDAVAPSPVPEDSAEAVINSLKNQATQAALILKTEAVKDDTIKIIEAAPVGLYDPIIYPLGILTSTYQKDVATDFVKFLSSPQAEAVFGKQGYAVLAKK